MSPSGRPVAGLVLASVLFGGALTGTKYALRGFDAITLLLVELCCATAVLWLLLLRRPRSGCNQGRIPPSWRLALLLGLLEPGLAYLAETVGLTRTAASSGALIAGLESAFVVLLAVFVLRERPRGWTVLATGLAFGGLVALEGGSPFRGSGLGDLLVAAGVLSAAGYTVVIKRFAPDGDALALTAVQFAGATALTFAYAGSRWAAGGAGLPTHVAARYWFAAALVGIFGYGLSFVLFNGLIGQIAAGAASVVLNLIPVFGVISAVVLLRERLDVRTSCGAALIAAAVALFLLAERRSAEPDDALDNALDDAVVVLPPVPEPRTAGGQNSVLVVHSAPGGQTDVLAARQRD
jgi:drug/metabolite transporter (DMT)-like permease